MHGISSLTFPASPRTKGWIDVCPPRLAFTPSMASQAFSAPMRPAASQRIGGITGAERHRPRIGTVGPGGATADAA